MRTLTANTIQISGGDAATFLQNFITCNIEDLKEGPLLAAACNQKGRIIANFWIWWENNRFYLQLPDSMTTLLTEHLKKFRFRSQVTFEIMEKQAPREPHFTPIWIFPETSEQFTPQMIDLEKYGGVSFKKGCYLGQEIIARTEHLGKLKRHLYQLTFGKKVAVNIGDFITNVDGEKMGVIVGTTESTLFAVIEDRATQAPLYWKSHRIKRVGRTSPD